MRTLALDIGSVRIGVAVSDPLGIIAQGIGVWSTESNWKLSLDECVNKYEPNTILIGLPVRTTGEKGVEAEKVLSVAEEIQKSYPDIKVETWDERYTTAIAERVLLLADVSRRKRRQKIDKLAAVVILQSWLERK
ncbi:MAG: Holliday junction resolvase RuvX [Synergistaceae bacterium]|nr:Holliday junction resolvase RuvX [Synergistaceae bacterium]